MKTVSKMQVDNLKNRYRNKFIKEHDVSELEELGVVNEHNRSKVVAMKEA